MKNIAIITAPNTSNAGMISVDLAARHFFDALPVEYTFFRTHTQKRSPKEIFAGQQFQLLIDTTQLAPFDIIIYWGDFLNNPIYGLEDFWGRDRREQITTTQHESFERWKRLCLLKNFSRKKQKIISVGNNFQGLTHFFTTTDSETAREIRNLYESNFDVIFPRDPVSTNMLKRYCPNAARGNVQTGLDAAFLLDPYTVIENKSLPVYARKLKLTYYFGRTEFRGLSQMLASVSLATFTIPHKLSGWLRVNQDLTDRELLASFYQTLIESKVVITDTYHLCVNAMNLGIPVIGMGHPCNYQDGTLGDYKKQVLFEMMGRTDSYYQTSRIRLIPKDFFSISKLARNIRTQTRPSALPSMISAFRERLKTEVEN